MTHQDGDFRERLDDLAKTATCPWAPALHDQVLAAICFGNDLFELFLDPTMAYSAGVFRDEGRQTHPDGLGSVLNSTVNDPHIGPLSEPVPRREVRVPPPAPAVPTGRTKFHSITETVYADALVFEVLEPHHTLVTMVSAAREFTPTADGDDVNPWTYPAGRVQISAKKSKHILEAIQKALIGWVWRPTQDDIR